MDQAEYQRRLAQGYPESVARRIATGELPMDEASRMARMQEGDWKSGFFRGLMSEYKEGADRSPLTWVTSDRGLAEKYAGQGPEANVLPIAIRSQNPVNFGLRHSAVDMSPQDLGDRLYSRIEDKFDSGEIGERELSRRLDSVDRWVSSYGSESKQIKPAFKFWDSDKGFLSMLSDVGYDSITDKEHSNQAGALFKDLGVASSETVGVMDNSNVRNSGKAAFDPEYKGRNILGALGQGFGILGLLGLASAPREAQAQGLLEMLMPPTAEAFRAQGAGAGSDMPMTDEQYNEMVRMLNAR